MNSRILPCYDTTAKSRYPLEEGELCLSNCLKKMDFAHGLTWSVFTGMTFRASRNFLQ
jgi:hypothetical protein